MRGDTEVILVHHMGFTTSPGLDLAVISFVHEVVELVLHPKFECFEAA